MAHRENLRDEMVDLSVTEMWACFMGSTMEDILDLELPNSALAQVMRL